MSAAPPRVVGPQEARIEQLWSAVWAEHEKGGVHEPYIVIAESEIANFRTSLNSNNAAAVADFLSAENLHIFHSRHFAAAIDQFEGYKGQLRQIMSWTYGQISSFNEHSVRSLSVANGGIVIATLAYIQAQPVVPHGFLWVIVFGSVGYILTLIGSHVVVILSGILFLPIMTMLAPRVSKADITTNADLLQRRTKIMLCASRPFFYLSALCLLAALWLGVSTLTEYRQPKPAQQAAQSVNISVPLATPSALSSGRGR